MFCLPKQALKNTAAFFTIGLMGVLGHFAYEWSGGVFLLGLFFPVNESTWEHLKLLFFPALLYFAAEYALTAQRPDNFWQATARGIFAGMAVIVVLFYTLTGIVGSGLGFINIFLYFVGLLAMLLRRNAQLRKDTPPAPHSRFVAWGVLVLTAILFMVWSVRPPDWGLFWPPAQMA